MIVATTIGSLSAEAVAALLVASANPAAQVAGAAGYDAYDCRPYRRGSDELCELEFDGPGQIWVAVNGYAASSYFELSSAFIAE